MTVKDSVKSARGEAVGAEIPVTIHASRTTQSVGKNLPPVHEDTKTVIVLQQGAVVRLTATLSTGETVVLTNRVTGADVLCRVGNIKSQPGIQHYVDLEFIQRAPGFWGDAVAAPDLPPVSQAPTAAPPPEAAVTHLTTPAAIVPPPVAVPAPPPPPPVAVVAPPPQAPQAQQVNIAPPPPVYVAPPPPPAPAPVMDLPPAAAAEPLRPAPLAEPVTASWMTPQSSSVTPMRGGADQSSFGAISAEAAGGRSSASSSKALLGIAAAVALVLAGAGGYWISSRQARPAGSPALQQAANAPSVQPAPSMTSFSAPMPTPIPVIESAPVTLQPEAELRPVPDAPTARVPAVPVAATRVPAKKHSVTADELKVQAPKAKAVPARMDSSYAPPPMAATLNLGDAGAASALLGGVSAGPAPPPVNSGFSVGGQLQPPQLLTSTAPVYPQSARLLRLQGVVVVDALVDETGKVAETTVVTGPPQLTSAAQESVRSSKYKPAQLNGKPIPVHTRVSVKFALQ